MTATPEDTKTAVVVWTGERLEALASLGRHNALLAGIAACLDTDRAPPSVGDFMQWRADLRKATAVRLADAVLLLKQAPA
jgi:hypothetical protein